MRAQGLITPSQESAALRVRPRIQPYRQPSDPRYGYAKEFLRQQFRNEFGGDNPPDWQVHTAFLPEVQDAAERAVAAGIDRLRRPGLEAALVAIDPATGDILAMVGGASYARSTFNRAVRSKRQPGSAFKPLVYAAALAKGYSPVSVLDQPAARLGAERSRVEPEERRGTTGRADAARRAARIEQSGRRRPAAAHRHARGAAARRRCRVERAAGRAVACARHRRGDRRSISPPPTRCFPATARSRGRAA